MAQADEKVAVVEQDSGESHLRRSFKKAARNASVAIVLSTPILAATPADAEAKNHSHKNKQHTHAVATPVQEVSKFTPVCDSTYTPPPHEKRVKPHFDVPPAQQQSALMQAGFRVNSDKKADGIFIQSSVQAVKEYRALMGKTDERDTLSKEDYKELQGLLKQLQIDKRKEKLPDNAAFPLRLAALKTGVKYEDMVKAYKAGGNVTDSPTAVTSSPENSLFKFDDTQWLYLVKQHGAECGLGYLADKISIADPKATPAPAEAKEQPSTNTVLGRLTSLASGFLNQYTEQPAPPVASTQTAAPEKPKEAFISVDDTTALRQILGLRDNPRIAALMAAHYTQEKDTFPKIAYEDVTGLPDEAIKKKQEALLTLGFDIGMKEPNGINNPLTRASLKDYEALTDVRPELRKGKTEKYPYIENTEERLFADAEKAKADSAKFTNQWNNVTPDVAFAIRQADRSTNIGFGYMMQLVSRESGFQDNAAAETSSAVGLSQFIEEEWLKEFKKHGAKYGYGDLAAHVVETTNMYGQNTTTVYDPFIRQEILDLRKTPYISAIFGAEHSMRDINDMQCALPSKPLEDHEKYVGHVMGSGPAVRLIKLARNSPDTPAADVFPQEARTNAPIFFKTVTVPPPAAVDAEGAANKKPAEATTEQQKKTAGEVLAWFKGVFNSAYFDKKDAPPPTVKTPQAQTIKTHHKPKH